MFWVLVTTAVMLVAVLVIVGMAVARWAAANGRRNDGARERDGDVDLVAPDHAEYGWATARAARLRRAERAGVKGVPQGRRAA
ncbi:hypothetical protein CLV92_115108 [Kineococcus xinjiangensis]|uniref:Uncharacterized protein n=1 Tax=Kineococcus xinjiangensis TaxID=512762 RepID=A0A2S6IDR3_9ACTN|nr:hypothetical protein [Kineococcus xinjiangensis]PPK92362.1 hypothetical protein CLV92_115108 [Kineococcus xinjiangensis]